MFRRHEKTTMPSATDDTGGAPLTKHRAELGGERERIRKVVSIDETESISPLLLGKSKFVDDFSLDRNPRHYSAKLGKRLSGRLSTPMSETSLTSSSTAAPSQCQDQGSGDHHAVQNVLENIATWLHEEKTRRRLRKAKKKTKTATTRSTEASDDHSLRAFVRSKTHRERRPSSASSDSGTSIALDKLEKIIDTAGGMRVLERISSRKSFAGMRRPASLRKLRQYSVVSSDNEHLDVEDYVPSCDAVLDNSKTMSYLGGTTASAANSSDLTALMTKDRDSWLSFKYEILRLAHTLKLKGWRHVPMSKSEEIDVERLSGALTNAVYVVAPPTNLPPRAVETDEGTQSQIQRKPPPKLLLRVYGPQVEHLIDRDAELQILRRLARKKIGPRLLGTFSNGRFEEYFHARTLKPQDLRVPETSKQIAKRMRELHDGIELLEEERVGGPFVWKNWDKWVDRCEKIVSYTDEQVHTEQSNASTAPQALQRSKFVCGTEWKNFRSTVEMYRTWLNEQYGGPEALRDHLVFAHNDTQYGNILRVEPPGESPLLLPANEHKQLIVIDFEYANANPPGLEFANHFTEWCYNYHDQAHPYACNTSHYPTPAEQRRFLLAYIQHRPTHAPAAPIGTPKLLAKQHASSITDHHTAAAATTSSTLSSSIAHRVSASLASLHLATRTRHVNDAPSYFSLPQAKPVAAQNGTDTAVQNVDDPTAAAAAALEDEVAVLERETRLWRVANSAQWVAWGVMQAQVPGFEDKADELATEGHAEGRGLGTGEGTDPLGEEGREMARDLADRRPERGEAGGGGFGDVDGGRCQGGGGGEVVGESEDEGKREVKSEGGGEEGEEFDYLGYARERAMFFWGDCLQLGFVNEEELQSWGLGDEVKLVAFEREGEGRGA